MGDNQTAEVDRQRLADFDTRAAGWAFLDNEGSWPRIHHDALFLRRLLRESEAERERRQTELLEANNREVERRRKMIAVLRELETALDEHVDDPCCGWGPALTLIRETLAAAEAPDAKAR